MILFWILREALLITAQGPTTSTTTTTSISSSTATTTTTTTTTTEPTTTTTDYGSTQGTIFSTYWGQEISQYLFENDTRFGIKYNPNVIPIGSEDYTDILSKDFLSAKDFIEKKCVQLDEYFSSKF